MEKVLAFSLTQPDHVLLSPGSSGPTGLAVVDVEGIQGDLVPKPRSTFHQPRLSNSDLICSPSMGQYRCGEDLR